MKEKLGETPPRTNEPNHLQLELQLQPARTLTLMTRPTAIVFSSSRHALLDSCLTPLLLIVHPIHAFSLFLHFRSCDSNPRFEKPSLSLCSLCRFHQTILFRPVVYDKQQAYSLSFHIFLFILLGPGPLLPSWSINTLRSRDNP